MAPEAKNVLISITVTVMCDRERTWYAVFVQIVTPCTVILAVIECCSIEEISLNYTPDTHKGLTTFYLNFYRKIYFLVILIDLDSFKSL